MNTYDHAVLNLQHLVRTTAVKQAFDRDSGAQYIATRTGRQTQRFVDQVVTPQLSFHQCYIAAFGLSDTIVAISTSIKIPAMGLASARQRSPQFCRYIRATGHGTIAKFICTVDYNFIN